VAIASEPYGSCQLALWPSSRSQQALWLPPADPSLWLSPASSWPPPANLVTIASELCSSRQPSFAATTSQLRGHCQPIAPSLWPPQAQFCGLCQPVVASASEPRDHQQRALWLPPTELHGYRQPASWPLPADHSELRGPCQSTSWPLPADRSELVAFASELCGSRQPSFTATASQLRGHCQPIALSLWPSPVSFVAIASRSLRACGYRQRALWLLPASSMAFEPIAASFVASASPVHSLCQRTL